jgi:hypothetical protein
MVNHFKSTPLQSMLFSAMQAAHTQPLLHTEVTYLEGGMLSKFCKLKQELTIFLSLKSESELTDLLNHKTWCNVVAFLTSPKT